MKFDGLSKFKSNESLASRPNYWNYQKLFGFANQMDGEFYVKMHFRFFTTPELRNYWNEVTNETRSKTV